MTHAASAMPIGVNCRVAGKVELVGGPFAKGICVELQRALGRHWRQPVVGNVGEDALVSIVVEVLSPYAVTMRARHRSGRTIERNFAVYDGPLQRSHATLLFAALREIL
jgi:hypothetical protein